MSTMRPPRLYHVGQGGFDHAGRPQTRTAAMVARSPRGLPGSGRAGRCRRRSPPIAVDPTRRWPRAPRLRPAHDRRRLPRNRLHGRRRHGRRNQRACRARSDRRCIARDEQTVAAVGEQAAGNGQTNAAGAPVTECVHRCHGPVPANRELPAAAEGVPANPARQSATQFTARPICSSSWSAVMKKRRRA